MNSLPKTLILLSALLLSHSALATVNLFACEPEWASLAQAIGGDHVKITTATSGLQDPHHVQARPSLIAAARRADLLACTGAELEIGWLPVLLQKSGNPKIQSGQPGYFMATNFVDLLEIPVTLDRSEGDIHADGNPHIQTDPRRIAQVAGALAERLQEVDPENAKDYQARYKDFSQRWQQAILRWEKQAAFIKGKSVVVHHKNWVYLENWLNLKELAALEPKPGIPPTTSHLSHILAAVEGKPVLAIVRAAYQSPKASRWLSSKTGIPAVVLPFTVGGTDRAKDLFSLFDDTIAQLTEAVK